MGQNLRKLRQERGWTQKHVAELVDSNMAYVSTMERGHGMGTDLLSRLCEAFGVDEQAFTRSPSVQEGQTTIAKLPEVTRMILEELGNMPEYEQLRLLANMIEKRIKGRRKG